MTYLPYLSFLHLLWNLLKYFIYWLFPLFTFSTFHELSYENSFIVLHYLWILYIFYLPKLSKNSRRRSGEVEDPPSRISFEGSLVRWWRSAGGGGPSISRFVQGRAGEVVTRLVLFGETRQGGLSWVLRRQTSPVSRNEREGGGDALTWQTHRLAFQVREGWRQPLRLEKGRVRFSKNSS